MTGYDPSIFKTSAQLPFVRRHRQVRSNTAIPSLKKYSVDPSSVSVLTEHGAACHQVIAILIDDTDPSDTPLKLSIRCYPRGVFRVTIDDGKPMKHERFVPDSVLNVSEENIPVDIDPSSLVIDQASQCATLSFPTSSSSPSSSISCRIHFSPFRVDVENMDQNGTRETVVTINSSNCLRYDAFEKEEPEEFAGFTDVRKRGAESVGIDVSFPLASHLHGLPERTADFSLPDTVRAKDDDSDHGIVSLSEPYRLFNVDVPFYEENSPTCLYGCIPLLYARSCKSSAGLFWHNTSETYVDVSSTYGKSGQGSVVEDAVSSTGKSTHWYSETGRVDMFVLPGPSPKHVYQQYLQLTGMPAKQPHFALGYHQCRYSYISESDVHSVDKGFDEHRIPYDVMWLDIDHTDEKRYFTWNYDTFPNPSQLRKGLQDKGRKMVTIIDPHVKVTDPSYFLHQLASSQRLYIRNGPSTTTDSEKDNLNSSPSAKDLVSSCWPGKSSWLDFNDEKVRRVWSEQFTPAIYKHFGEGMYVWNDMNEPSTFEGPERTIPKDALHHNGMVEHRHVHNIYGHSMVQGTFEGLSKFYNSDRVFVLTRSFFAGSQKWSCVWTGDNTASWSHLHCSVRMLLTLSLCGYALCGADVGGFFGDPTPELVTRWYQAGAFQPFFRGHSMCRTERREPWLFGEPYTSLIRAAIRARYKFMPFWITLFEAINQFKFDDDEAHQQSLLSPPMRPLWWHFPELNIADEVCQSSWMVGDALFIAPVLKPGSHTITFPTVSDSSWYDLFHPEAPGIPVSSGSITYDDVPLERMFVFQRPGTIVPMTSDATSETCTNSGSTFSGGLCLSVALSGLKKATGVVYVDDINSILRFDVQGEFITLRGEKDHNMSKSNVIISSVVVYGLSNPITTVCCDGEAVPFKYNAKGQSLSIERLNIKVDGAWRLLFK